MDNKIFAEWELEFWLGLKRIELMQNFKEKTLNSKQISYFLKNNYFILILYFVTYGKVTNVIENRDLILDYLIRTKPFQEDNFIWLYSKFEERKMIAEKNKSSVLKLINNNIIKNKTFIYKFTEITI